MPDTQHLRRLATPIAAALAVALASSIASAQSGGQWHFKYFAGDPPSWKDHPGGFARKADCEVARAEKSVAGYPVGDCYRLPSVGGADSAPRDDAESAGATRAKARPSPRPRKHKATSATTSSADANTGGDDLARVHAQKKRQGCKKGCEDTFDTCQIKLPDVQICVQERNSSCVEACTERHDFPHHQCLNEICAPNEINLADWKAQCEARRRKARAQCFDARAACVRQCDAS